jgi:hypothetical protein
MWYMGTCNLNPRMCNQIRGWYGTSFGEEKWLEPDQRSNGTPSRFPLRIPKYVHKKVFTNLK